VYCSHKTNVGTVEALGHNIQFPHMFAAKETIVEVDTSFQFKVNVDGLKSPVRIPN